MTSFVVFGGVLLILVTTVVWSAVRAAKDTGADLGPAERRDAAIEALRQLEFEYRTEKLSEEEYRAIRDRLETEALAARDALGAGGCEACGQTLAGSETYCPGCGSAIG